MGAHACICTLEFCRLRAKFPVNRPINSIEFNFSLGLSPTADRVARGFALTENIIIRPACHVRVKMTHMRRKIRSSDRESVASPRLRAFLSFDPDVPSCLLLSSSLSNPLNILPFYRSAHPHTIAYSSLASPLLGAEASFKIPLRVCLPFIILRLDEREKTITRTLSKVLERAVFGSDFF